jgi:hypothetical protein
MAPEPKNWYAVLQPVDVQTAVGQIDLLPSERAQFGCPECQQDYRRVAMFCVDCLPPPS